MITLSQSQSKLLNGESENLTNHKLDSAYNEYVQKHSTCTHHSTDLHKSPTFCCSPSLMGGNVNVATVDVIRKYLLIAQCMMRKLGRHTHSHESAAEKSVRHPNLPSPPRSSQRLGGTQQVLDPESCPFPFSIIKFQLAGQIVAVVFPLHP